MKFPQEAPGFDPTDLFDAEHKNLYMDPGMFSFEPDSSAPPPPRVRIHADRAGAFELLHFLDKHKRLRLVPVGEAKTTHLCGAFSLIKDELRGRLILDARPPNEVERTLNSYTKTLGCIDPLLQIELLPREVLVSNGDDLRDYYYGFVVSAPRMRRNCLNFHLNASEARGFSCWEDRFRSDEILLPALSTMAMGDCNAVELGQGAHILLGLRSAAFTPDELATIHGRAPRGQLAAGVLIDDFIMVEKVLRTRLLDSTPLESEERMEAMNAEYRRVGLLAHSEKAFRRSLQASFWGHAVDGDSGFVRAALTRLLPLMEATAAIARLGHATVGLLEVVTGSWVSVLQVRKRMMCLLDLYMQCNADEIRATWCDYRQG